MKSKPRLTSAASLLVALGLAAAGCGEDYSDEAHGVLDLTAFYDKGVAVSSNPTITKVPDQISPLAGFIENQRAEYYDFGPVPTVRDPKTGAPTAALVSPMYFFYTPEGYPLFSAPVRESRDGSDWMLGGKHVLNPNPKDYCTPDADPTECAALNAAEKKIAYPVRRRDVIIDPIRGTADYQRPLIDVSPVDGTAGNPVYSGLWEIIEVTVPRGYDPDAIKHVATLKRAFDSHSYKSRNTGKVINCPLIDERTYIPRGVTDRPVFRPRIELWYRRKMTFCYLANGWETVGDLTGRPYFGPSGAESSDAYRLDTFDIARLALGEGKAAATRLIVPVKPLFIPAVYTDSQTGAAPTVTRLPDNVLSRGRPRHSPSDPPGYTPIRWMWDLVVDPDYKIEELKSAETLDPGATRPQSPLVTKNFPLRGVAVQCSLPRKKVQTGAESYIEKCGTPVPEPGLPDKLDPRGDPACTPFGLECNKDTCFCDAPFVGYGQACGPGIAQCSKEKDDYSEFGSTCFPPWGGFCYKRCKGGNARAAENEGKKATEFVDTRCGSIKGYRCFGYIDGGICLKNCDQNVSDPDDSTMVDKKQCSATTMVGMEAKDIAEGQTCQDYGLQICAWPDGYSP